MNAVRNDPDHKAALRSLLVEQARLDSARAPARAHRRRVIGATAGFGLVLAAAAGVVTIAATGLPIFGSPPAATAPASPIPTPTPTPTKSPTPPPTPSTPATPPPVAERTDPLTPIDATPPSVDDFRAAVIAAGFDCSTWQPVVDPGPAGVIETGQCLPSQLSYATFASEADVATVLQLNEDSLETARFLYGPRWIVGIDDVTGESDDLIALQSVLGGTLNWDPSVPAGD